MPTWSEMLQAFGGSAKRLLETLRTIDVERTVVTVQVEGTQVRFPSRLLLKDDKVVFAKPETLGDGLRPGSVVRFKLPEDPRREVRLEVYAPHVNLASGSAVFLCRVPASGPSPAKREADRYGTAHLGNLLLVIPNRAREFRVMDISAGGCRVLTSSLEAETYFPLGRALTGVRIQAGKRASIELEAVIPRAHQNASVGCEFRVTPEGVSQAYFSQLMRSLDRAATERLGR